MAKKVIKEKLCCTDTNMDVTCQLRHSKEHDMCPPTCASRCDTTLHRSVCEKHSVSIEPMDAMGWL